jgi:hypothetical protein
MKKEKEEQEKEISFKDEVVEYFKSLYKRSKEFIKNNKIILSILFIVLFIYFLLTDINTKHTYCNNKGGAPPQPSQQQQQQQQQQKQQQAYQLKTQLAQFGFNKIGSTIANSTILSDLVCYIMSFLRTGVAFFSIVFAVMMIPGVPVFGFMLLLFGVLRSKVADIKAL